MDCALFRIDCNCTSTRGEMDRASLSATSSAPSAPRGHTDPYAAAVCLTPKTSSLLDSSSGPLWHMVGARMVPRLLRSSHETHRTTDARCPCPDAVRRHAGTRGQPRRGVRNGAPRADRPARRRHRRAGQPRDRPPADEREVVPNGRWHRGGVRCPRLRDAVRVSSRVLRLAWDLGVDGAGRAGVLSGRW